MPQHIDTFFESAYLSWSDLGGHDFVVTIAGIKRGEVKSEKGTSVKAIVSLTEFSKPMVVNRTNAKRIAALYGKDTDAWIGRRITIFPTTVPFGDEDVNCIRVRKEAPGNGQAEKGPVQ